MVATSIEASGFSRLVRGRGVGDGVWLLGEDDVGWDMGRDGAADPSPWETQPFLP